MTDSAASRSHVNEHDPVTDPVDVLCRRARESDSGMVRVLSRGEIEWLVEPLLDVVDEAYPGDDNGAPRLTPGATSDAGQ